MRTTKLKITAIDGIQDAQPFTFTAFRFENEVVVVPAENIADSWYESTADIQANGNAEITQVDVVGHSDWTIDMIKESIEASQKEFGLDAVPARAIELLQ